MKRILSLLSFSALALGAAAQPTWFAENVGATLTYERSDGKKAEQFQYKVTDVTEDDGKKTITFDSIITGIDNPTGCRVWTAEGRFHTDAKTIMGQYGDLTGAKGHGPILPESPKVGADLAECTVELPNILTTANFKNVRFTKHEALTVRAGTFDAWCLEYDTEAKVGFIKSTTHTECWYAKGVGVIKEVSSGKKKVISTIELIATEGVVIPDGDWIKLHKEEVELGEGGSMDGANGSAVTEKLEAPAAIDLGLSVLWANRNLGATKPQEEGLSFQWSDKDQAQMRLEGGWRMPTAEEVNELIEKCTFDVVNRDNVMCCKVTGPSGRFIFLPIIRKADDRAAFWSSDPSGSGILFDKKLFLPIYSSVDKTFFAMIRPVITVTK